jgi:glycosyltransferase involved in cell wall biosynthesis
VKVAYLTNQYPKTSHTFIRREIAGVEAAGLSVERISVRASDEELVDECDRAERRRTRVLLRRGALGLLPDALAVSVSHPLRTLRALRTALVISRTSDRGLLRHLAYVAEACVLLRWTKDLGIEHVHAHFSTNPTAVALLCHELGGPPYSFTAHGTADFNSGSADALPRKIAQASFVIAVCEDGRRRLLLRTPPGHEDKVHVVRCGVDAQFLGADAHGVPVDARLVCVARLSEEKGIAVLLHAARSLADDGIEFEICLLGDGPERDKLEALVAELGLAAHVRFEGWCSGAEVRARVLDSRALVLASFSEGLPVVIMEAFALKRPVIGTSVGGIAELVVPGDCGWIVSPGSESELADAMREALALSSADLDSMGERGARRVAAAHDALTEARGLARLFLDSQMTARIPAARPEPRAT